jgi:hypothetical protein
VRRLVLGGSLERVPEVIRAVEDDQLGVSVAPV